MKTSYTLPSVTTHIVEAKRSMKDPVVSAIISRDIGRRNNKKTGTRRMTKIVKTNKNPARPPDRVSEKKVILSSVVGFVESSTFR